ncbi:MAG: carbon-nitrogen hydrolase family protein [Chloroflexi bacterium]|nr:carbon-nitrogen hydrolase family protein [Chloroflexota bacterium]
MPKLRVSAIQLAVTSDVDENLATCLRLIDKAAESKPDVMVLPEFINHIMWFDSPEHCYEKSVDLDGDFPNAIGEKAKEHNSYIKVNVTLRRGEIGKVTGTNILFDPEGKKVAITDKQVLMGNENNFLIPAAEPAEIVHSENGSFGMYCCMDGVIPEPARALALNGANILLNSLNSFALDEASLHIPVRAAENKIYVVAANKVGGLVPPAMAQIVAERLKIPVDAVVGAGESQIVAPDGTILAKAPKKGEAIIFADIDIDDASNKLRPDGTDIFSARRAELYTPIADAPASGQIYTEAAERVKTAIFQPESSGQERSAEIDQAIKKASKDGIQLLVLPELSCQSTDEIKSALDGCEMVVATSIQEENAHVGVLIGRDGILLRQPQLHACGRHGWATDLGDSLNVIDLSWGRFALIVGGDVIYPEVFRLAVLQNVQVVACPTKILEAWEFETGWIERAAENRMNALFATQPSDLGASMVVAMDKDFTLWTQWEKQFDGNINYPLVTRAERAPGMTRATIFPSATSNRVISQKTDLVENRPWWLAKGIITD